MTKRWMAILAGIVIGFNPSAKILGFDFDLASSARADAPVKNAAATPAKGVGAMLRAVHPAAAEPPVPPVEAVKGDAQLEGLYMQQRMVVWGGHMSLSHTFYYFFPDGHMYFAMPTGGLSRSHPTAVDFAALQKADPKNCGAYRITGKKILMQAPGEKPVEHSFEFTKEPDAKTLLIDDLFATRGVGFKDNQTISGSYENGFIAGGGNTVVSVSKSIEFRADGTFKQTGFSALESGSNIAKGESNSSGKYKLSDQTLELDYSDGRKQTISACIVAGDASDTPGNISMDGTVYSRQSK